MVEREKENQGNHGAKENGMPLAQQEISDHTSQLRSTLEKYAGRISDELQTLVHNNDWEAMKSVLRVLDAYSRAKELREQGQPARAHFWLVGVSRKKAKPKKGKTPSSPLPAA